MNANYLRFSILAGVAVIALVLFSQSVFHTAQQGRIAHAWAESAVNASRVLQIQDQNAINQDSARPKTGKQDTDKRESEPSENVQAESSGKIPVSRYWIGASCEPASKLVCSQLDIHCGLAVRLIARNSPAKKCKLQVHDILIEIDGKPLDCPVGLSTYVDRASRKDPLKITYLRSGQRGELTLVPELRPVSSTNRAVFISETDGETRLKELFERGEQAGMPELYILRQGILMDEETAMAQNDDVLSIGKNGALNEIKIEFSSENDICKMIEYQLIDPDWIRNVGGQKKLIDIIEATYKCSGKYPSQLKQKMKAEQESVERWVKIRTTARDELQSIYERAQKEKDEKMAPLYRKQIELLNADIKGWESQRETVVAVIGFLDELANQRRNR